MKYAVDTDDFVKAFAQLIPVFKTENPGLGSLEITCHDGTVVRVEVERRKNRMRRQQAKLAARLTSEEIRLLEQSRPGRPLVLVGERDSRRCDDLADRGLLYREATTETRKGARRPEVLWTTTPLGEAVLNVRKAAR